MKRLLLIAISLISLHVNAQVFSSSELNLADKKSVIFDFTMPESLNPAVICNGGNVGLNDRVFKSDSVSLGFIRTGTTIGAEEICNTYDNVNYVYWLEVGSNTQLIFNCNNGALDRIEFLNDPKLSSPDVSGIAVLEGQHGTFYKDDNTKTHVWSADENNLQSQLILANKSIHYARLYSIKIDYYLPLAQFVPQLSIPTSEILNTFSSVQLAFSEDVTFKDSPYFRITYRGNEISKNVSVDGKIVTISLPSTVSDDGDLNIHIPAGCFVADKGYYNKELDYTYKIVKKRDVFVPVSYIPENNSHVDELVSGEIGFAFDGAISEVDESQRFRLFKEGKSSPVCLMKPVRGAGTNSVKLEFVEAVSNVITDNGNYTIIIPEKSFYNYKGDVDYESWNPELTISYALGNIETLVPVVTVVPESETVPEEFKGLTLEFDKTINYVENEGLAIKFNDENVTFSVTVVDKTASIVLAEPIVADGLLSIHIPASTFITEDFFANKELDYAYTIKTAVSKKKDEAQEILKQTGVGFPTEESPAYVALKSLVKSEDATVDGIEAAIAALYSETVIKLPSNGEFYKISAVNNEGEILYVGLNNDNIIITDDINNAAVFETSQDNGRIVFKSMDGKYLPILTASENNLTESITDVNKLQLTKLAIAGKEKATYGLMAMYGQLGENDLGGYNNTYTVFNFESKSLPESTTETPRFETKFSSAIKLVSIDSQEALVKITPVDVDCQSVENKYCLVIKFFEKLNVILNAEPTKVTITPKGGSESIESDMTATGNNSEFVVSLGSMNAGDYVLTIPAKRLKCTIDDSERLIDEVVANFNIKNILDADFTINDLYYYPIKDYLFDKYYRCEDLNGFGFYIKENDLFNGPYFFKTDENNGIIYNLYNYTTKTFIMMETYIKDEDKVNYGTNEEEVIKTVLETGKADYVIVDGALYKIEPYYKPGKLVSAIGSRVKLRNVWGTVYRTGKLVNPLTNNNTIDETRVVVEFNEGEIKQDELPDDDYVLEIEKASFGDANFAQYLSDQNSIESKRCVVNPKMLKTIAIDRNAVGGIKDAVYEKTKVNGIFDLMGRKVQDMNRPGIYIVNGKKFVVK